MNLPEAVNNFINESPVSLVATKGGPLSLSDIQKFYESEIAVKISSKKFGQLCLAGLMFAQDYIWEGHEIVQDYPDTEASWWHAFMHRMEGDYGNSAYWYRRVGDNALQAEFYSLVKGLNLDGNISSIQQRSDWDPFEFNGLIGKHRNESEESLKKVHTLELKFILSRCLEKAFT